MKTFVLPLLLAFPFAATAHGPAAEPAVTPAVDPAAEPVADTVLIRAADSDATASDVDCVRETGTRVTRRDKNGCTGLPGESYDKEQIDRTGAVDTADAIRRLNAGATIRR